MKLLLTLAAAAASANAYWLMGIEDFITTERIDPIVNPGKVSGHAHSVLGGSNFRFQTTTAQLRESECTSIPIPQDKSAYWFPHLYFQWNNGSFSSLNGGAVIYYLFSDTPGTTTAFPDDFRMLSGDPTLRTYDPNSFAQQAVTFLCLDFNGVSTKHNELPTGSCPSGIRAQINFPSCWDGKNLDSPDHKSHVSFLSTGPDSGSCSDPKFPVVLPRIFMEVYWSSSDFDSVRSQARNTSQPFVFNVSFAHGDPTGYGYHADFINGWDKGVLQKAVDNCHCNPFGDPTCCVNQGIFDMNQGKTCRITKSIDEQTTGTLLKLPGNNPVQPFGKKATIFADNTSPNLISPVFAYTGDSPTATGSIVGPAPVNTGGSTPAASSAAASTAATAAPTVHSSSAITPPASSSAAAASSQVSSAPATTHAPTTTANVGIPSISISIPSFSIPSISIPSISKPPILGVVTSAAAAKPTSSIVAPANAGPAGSSGSQSGSSNSNGLGSGSHNSSGSSGKTCSSKKKRAMEKHRRRAAFEHGAAAHDFFTN
ncbi:hypothetical protein CPC08DRAFT_724247 [Agrocybe pediades]|nr:hypothetical protein CPC08DRAFT_724247 [Agrocybe pediades]